MKDLKRTVFHLIFPLGVAKGWFGSTHLDISTFYSLFCRQYSQGQSLYEPSIWFQTDLETTEPDCSVLRLNSAKFSHLPPSAIFKLDSEKKNKLSKWFFMWLITVPAWHDLLYFVTEHSGTVFYHFSFTSIKVFSRNILSFQQLDLGYLSQRALIFDIRQNYQSG